MTENKENFVRAPTDGEIELAVERLSPNWARAAPRSRTGGKSYILQSLAHGVPLPLRGPVHSATHERAVTCWDSVRSPGAAVCARARRSRSSARRSSHFGLVPRGAPGGTFVTYNCRTFAEGAALLSKTSLIT
jgi:hypothetical protein